MSEKEKELIPLYINNRDQPPKGHFRLGKYYTIEDYEQELENEQEYLSEFFNSDDNKWFYIRCCIGLISAIGFLIGVIGIMKWVITLL